MLSGKLDDALSGRLLYADFGIGDVAIHIPGWFSTEGTVIDRFHNDVSRDSVHGLDVSDHDGSVSACIAMDGQTGRMGAGTADEAGGQKEANHKKIEKSGCNIC